MPTTDVLPEIDLPVQAPAGLVHLSVREPAVLEAGSAFTVADARAQDMPLVSVNPALTAMTGCSEHAVLGRTCRFLQGPATDPAAVSRLRHALATGTSVTVVLLNHRRDGTPFWNEIALSPVTDAQAVVTHIVRVQADVIERVEAQRLARQAFQAEHVARLDAEQARADAEQPRPTPSRPGPTPSRPVPRRRSRSWRSAGPAMGPMQPAGRLRAPGPALSCPGDAWRCWLRATSVLAETLDVEQALDRLARLVIPALADWVVIDLATEGGMLGTRTVMRHRDGRDALTERLQGADAVGGSTERGSCRPYSPAPHRPTL